MPEKRRPRASSANRTEKQHVRRSSLTEYPTKTSGSGVNLSAIDLRSEEQKLEDLQKGLAETTNIDQRLENLVLSQLYTRLVHGEISLQNARAYANLSDFYVKRKWTFLFQAKLHALSARDILEKIQRDSTEESLIFNELSFDIYHLLTKCSLKAKIHLCQLETKMKNKVLLRIDTKHLHHDLGKMKHALSKMKEFMSNKEIEPREHTYVSMKFQVICSDIDQYDSSIDDVLEKLLSLEPPARHLDLQLTAAAYLLNFDRKKQRMALQYFDRAVDMAELLFSRESSEQNRSLVAHTILKRSEAQVQADLCTEQTEIDFRRAIKAFQTSTESMNKNVLKVIDGFARYYLKVEKYQDALNILCETLPDKIQLFGEFSDEVIQTESQIGAIYLREGECLNAAEHLKVCFDLQEFVYGPKDPRTLETRQALDILKRNPMVSRSFFGRTQQAIREDRPAFRISNRVSYNKEDLQWIQPVTKKPPIASKSSRGSKKNSFE